jgi:peroxiredoxin
MQRIGHYTKCLAVLVGFALGAGSSARQAVAQDDGAAPDFVLKSVAGVNLRLSEFRGRVVMLNFWASWCGDCRAELRSLAESHALYRDTGLELLAVSVDRTAAQARDAADAWPADFPVLHDAGGEVARLYAVTELPMTVLIDREGRIREVLAGYRRDNEPPHVEPVRALLRE